MEMLEPSMVHSVLTCGLPPSPTPSSVVFWANAVAPNAAATSAAAHTVTRLIDPPRCHEEATETQRLREKPIISLRLCVSEASSSSYGGYTVVLTALLRSIAELLSPKV